MLLTPLASRNQIIPCSNVKNTTNTTNLHYTYTELSSRAKILNIVVV